MSAASFPMYLRKETRHLYARLWTAIRDAALRRPGRRHGSASTLPAGLSHPDDLVTHWTAPGLALSQACGLPYRTRLHDRVGLVGAFDFTLPGCPPGYYSSVIVLRAGDDRAAPGHWPAMRLACNDPASQSGWAAPAQHLAARGLAFGEVVVTGSHRGSARAVAEGRADLAAIDAQTWRMMQRWDGALTNALREVARTEPTPGLPLICGRDRDPEDMAEAIDAALAALAPADRAVLDIRALVRIPAASYLAVPTPPFPAPLATGRT